MYSLFAFNFKVLILPPSADTRLHFMLVQNQLDLVIIGYDSHSHSCVHALQFRDVSSSVPSPFQRHLLLPVSSPNPVKLVYHDTN